MQSPVDQIKDKLTIDEVIGGYITLEKTGANFKAKCPFHNEKTPSFFISPDRGSYYCFGCNAKGDIFSFVQAFEGIDFMGSLRLLADKAGVSLATGHMPEISKRDRLYKVMEAACVFYEKHLERRKEAQEYLQGRGLKIETSAEWRLGYAPQEWRALYEMMLAKGISKDEMIEAGLVKEGEKGTVYDRFRGRIMFPLFDASSRVIGFSGRIFGDTQKMADGSEPPKYLNSPETVLFHKSEVLYGLNKAKGEMRKTGQAILVEGQMDLLMSHQAGFANTVATSGTSLTSEHIGILSRFAKTLLVAYDSDRAGRKASEKAYAIALGASMEVKLISLQQGEDPADVIRENPEIWKQALLHPKHLIEVALAGAKAEANGNSELLRNKVIEEVLPLLAAVGSTIERSSFVAKVAFELGVREEVVWDDLKRLKSARYVGDRNMYKQLPVRNRELDLLKRCWSILFALEKNDSVTMLAFEKRLKEIMEDSFEAGKELCTAQKSDLTFEAEVKIGPEKFQAEFEESLKELHIEIIQTKLERAMADLQMAEKAGDKAKADDLLLLCQTYAGKISLMKIRPKQV